MAVNATEAFQIYKDYYYNGNSLHTTPREMASIVERYSDLIPAWQKSIQAIADDENKYVDFDESDFDKFFTEGQNKGKSATDGHTRKDQAGDVAKATGDVVFSVAGTAGGFSMGRIVGTNAAKKVGEAAMNKAAKEAAAAAAQKAGEQAAKKAAEEATTKAAAEAAKKAAEETAKKAGETVTEEAIKQAGEKAAAEATEEITSAASQEAVQKATEETSAQATKAGAKEISAYFAIAMGVITAVTYWIKKPNKEGAKACEQMNSVMQQQSGALSEAQASMQCASEQVAERSNQAASKNEEANYQIDNLVTTQDYYGKTYMKLKAKIDAGTPLTEEEKQLYRSVASSINKAGKDIKVVQDKNSEEVEVLHDEMDSFNVDYENAAGVMAETTGLTEYAASFDKQTQVLSYVEAGSQGLNAASTTMASYRLFSTSGLAWWNYAIALVGLGAAASSVKAMTEQLNFAKTAKAEIDSRKITENVNVETREVHEAELDNYESYMVMTENLTVNDPTVIPNVDETLPENTSTNNTVNGDDKGGKKKQTEK